MHSDKVISLIGFSEDMNNDFDSLMADIDDLRKNKNKRNINGDHEVIKTSNGNIFLVEQSGDKPYCIYYYSNKTLFFRDIDFGWSDGLLVHEAWVKSLGSLKEKPKGVISSGKGSLWEKGYNVAIARAVHEALLIDKEFGKKFFNVVMFCDEKDVYKTESDFKVNNK